MTQIANTTALRFGLTDAQFDMWWNAALLPADADEFVHVLGGNKLGARFVCAMDYFTRIDARELTYDLIVRAYCIAKKVPPEALTATMRDTKVRLDAQCLYDDPAVRALLERLQYRSRQIAMERIAVRTYSTVEKLYDRADAEFEPELRLNMEKAALAASTTLLSIEERRASGEAKRREARAFRNVVEMSRAQMRDESAPPTLDEAKHTILMLRELFGADTLREMISAALPMKSEDSSAETIDAN